MPGTCTAGGLARSNAATGEDVTWILYKASLVDPDDAWMQLRYSVDGAGQNYRVLIASTPCHFGGRQWWWKCPRSGRRVAKLYLPPGAMIFAARQFYRLAYRSQRITALDRSHNRLHRLYRRLGADYEYFEQSVPPRPKGMHRNTYDRLTTELDDAMEEHDRLWLLGAASVLGRLTGVGAACGR